MAQKKKTTIYDIAKVADVSPGTVSRVINGDERISKDTVKKVKEIMAELKYVPRRYQTGMNKGDGIHSGKNQIVFVFQRFHLFAPIVSHLANILTDRNLEVTLKTFEQLRAQKNFSRHVAGVIFMNETLEDDQRQILELVPSVRIMGLPQRNVKWDQVTYDNLTIARLAADHLADAGHKQIAGFFTHGPISKHREKAFVKRAEERGCTVTTFTNAFHADRIKERAKVDAMFAKKRGKPTAAFCFNDNACVNFYRYCDKSGITPNDDIQVLSCDNSDRLGLLSPRPQSIDLCAQQMAIEAVQSLLVRMADPGSPYKTTIIDPTLI